MKVLVTGGAGYIGSTVASAFLDAGHQAVIVDDLSAGHAAFVEGRPFYRGDFADPAVLDTIFRTHPDIAATIHCAAYIVVPESTAQPLRYYDNNVGRTVTLLEQLLRLGCDRILFSSSGSVYASAAGGEVTESAPLQQTSPYARTKAIVEQVLADAAAAGLVRAISLRYFNPVGADPLLRTGQPRPTHTLAVDRLIEAHETGAPFTITGTTWPTHDGTAVRDYVHVWDVARAHVRAVEQFDSVVNPASAYEVFNIGTGRGTTVRELVALFESVVGTELDVREAPPRPGDALGCYANVDKAASLLGWRAGLTVGEAVADALAWRQRRATLLSSR